MEKKNFSGLNVGSFESRQQKEMERLIRKLGGNPFVAPSMREVPLEEHKSAFQLWDQIKTGAVDLLILFTGVGTRTLLDALMLRAPKEEVLEALRKIPILSRGPKPNKVLSEFGLKPELTVPEPNTWREILKVLDEKKDINGRRVAVQEYGESNRLFLAELRARGADVFAVPIYRAHLPIDTSPLMELIDRIIRGETNVLLFTNSTQVEHAFAMARQNGSARQFRKALSNVAIASVGPTCSATLRAFGAPPDIEPERPMMGALVAAAAEKCEAVLELKKKSPSSFSLSGYHRPPQTNMLDQSLFLKACRKEPVERTPVWLMRQAGRYMKEYRELRAKVSFIDLCKNSDLAAEVTVDAAHRLGVDAAIIFSDILLLAETLGFHLSYGKDQGPEISNPFRSESDLSRLKVAEVEEEMDFVFQAIRKTRASLKPALPLIGFAGAPFTMASYIVEGRGSKNFIATKKLMYDAPALWHALMRKIADATIHYLNLQVEAGAQAVQLFDSWVGCLSPEDYRIFVLPHTKAVIRGVVPGVPVISFGTQTAGLLPLFREAGGDVIGVDWRVELDEAWDQLGNVAIQGNLDPVALFSTKDVIRERVKRILNQAGGRPGHIFNLGHGVLPDTPIENVFALIEAVKEFSERKS